MGFLMPLPWRGYSFNRLTAIDTQHSRVRKEFFSDMKGKRSFLSQNVALVLDSQRRPAVIQSMIELTADYRVSVVRG